ncbi:hypothetical protein LEN26_012438 [Aphanomyces euteiches]|nr:hypothetical protein LEN26_012438 [Aphanomyces euteiches]KAH9127658.1 hypothetical protein AeMF1_002078 [Aphanomyces euteiches]KAH9194855.1 hypothetical protein AeNC1_003158 [Aphanomyces euteiches]
MGTDQSPTTIRVLDIQSDWQTTQDDAFWVSTTDRQLVFNPDCVHDAERIEAATQSPSVMHTVHKSHDPHGAQEAPMAVASQSRYSITIADKSKGDGSCVLMPFYTPHTQTPLHAQLYAVAASPNGNSLAIGGADGLFQVTQVHSQQSIQLPGHLSDVTDIKFFPSSVVALTGSTDFSLRIWSLQSFTCGAVLTGHRSAVQGIGILGRGRNVVSCASDSLVKVWHCGSGKSFREWALPATPTCLAVLEDLPSDLTSGERLASLDVEHETEGKLLVVGTEQNCFGLDVRMADIALTLPCISPASACAAVNSDAGAPMVLVGAENGGLYTYDLRNSAAPLHVVSRSSSAVHAINCASNGTAWIATGDGSCSRWEGLWAIPRVTGELVGPVYDTVNDVCESKHGIATVSRDGVLRSYSLTE